jgi:hypothetical protein
MWNVKARALQIPDPEYASLDLCGLQKGNHVPTLCQRMREEKTLLESDVSLPEHASLDVY